MMDQQNEENKISRQNGRDLYELDSNHIDTTYLPDVVLKMGEHNILTLLNARLNNPRFEVKFEFNNVVSVFMNEEFSGLALFYHDLIVPKTPDMPTKSTVQSILDVINISENENAITYSLYLGEGPYAITMSDTLNSINNNLRPRIEDLTNQLGINEYQLTFFISLMY